MNLLRWLAFLLDPSSALLDSFLPVGPTSIWSTVALPPLRNSGHAASVTSDLPQKEIPLFLAPHMILLQLIVVVFVII